MSFRELFNAINGFYDLQQQRSEIVRNIAYGASRYNAANTAFSKKQAKSISKQKFPWEKSSTGGKPEIISYDKVKGMFNMISKPADDG